MAELVLMPLFLIKPGTMKRADINRAKKMSGVCIVECSDPESARFLEPPIGGNVEEHARAALQLFRLVLRQQEQTFSRATLTKWFCDALLDETKPAVVPRVKAVKAQ